jgi:hypothetical protein
MKKKVLKFALAAILGVVVSYTVYSSKTDVSLSDLALENVEALAYPEWMYSDWYLINVTQDSHTCLPGGYFSCIL